jgi:hypothetical protein
MTRTLKIVNGDVVRSKASGRLLTVTGRDKAAQSLTRLLGLDEAAGLDALMGQPPEDESAFSARVQRNIRRAFDRLVQAQRGSQLAQRTSEERLASIQRMYVVPANFGGGSSKTGYALRVDTLTVAGQLVTTGGLLVPVQGE